MDYMERELTVRQRRFALGVASGLSKTKAHAAAYPNNMQKATREVAAKKLAKKPRVKSEIERLTLELLPRVEDMRAAYDHAFSTILKLTIESPDDRLRFDAARWLRAEYERREQLVEKALPGPTEAVIADLHRLYEKALGPRDAENPLVLEVDAESEAAVTPGPPSEPSQLAANALAEEPADADGGPVQRETRLNSLDSEPVFRRELIPGRFPPQYRRVRIR
jgi:hypothetical protein